MRDLRLHWSRSAFAALIALLAGLVAGCNSSSSSTRVMVLIVPASTTVALQGTTQFSATVANATDTTVAWQVNGVTGGNSTCGTISTNGLYTAPSVLPASTACSGGTGSTSACTTTTGGTTTTISGCVLITAVSNQSSSAKGTAAVRLTSGVAITITPTGTATVGTGETLSFVATVTGSTNLMVNWLVNSTQGGSSTTGTITSTTIGDGNLAHAATFTAPTAIPSPATVTIQAQSVVDTSQFQTASVTVVTAADPTLTAVSPLNIPAGAFSQDLYLSGTNFLSTTTVLFGGVNLATLTSGSVTAVNNTLIRAHVPFNLLGAAGTFTVVVQRQNGTATPAVAVNVVPVRPVLLAATPATLAQNSGPTTVELDGGYYTNCVSPNPACSTTPPPPTVSEFNGHLVGTSQDSTFPRTLQAAINSSDLTQAGQFSIAVRTPNATPPRSAVNLSIRPGATPVVSNTITGFSVRNGITGGPVAVAVNDVTGVPVVVDQGMNRLDLLNTSFTAMTSFVNVGTTPTSVAVHGLRNFALVADNGSSDVAVVDLSVPALAGQLPLTPGGSPPYTVGVDEVHDRAIVVGQNVAAATILDTSASPASPPTVLGTVPIFTGLKPQVAVLPQLGWAIVTPGGGGPLSVVDLTRLSIVFTSTINSTTRGVAVNTETKTLLLADPSSPSAPLFSLLNQSLASVFLNVGNVAAAANPLTNVALLLNPGLQQAVVLDMSTPAQLATVPLGHDPIAVALDPGSDKALVADDVDGTVTVIDLGATRSRSGEPQILQVSCPAVLPNVPTGCPAVIVSGTPGSAIPLTVIGAGFAPTAQIRLDETPIATTVVNSRELTASLPVAFLTQPRRIVVDVQNSTNQFSNVSNLLVAQAVPVGQSPQGVAIDKDRNLALVANSGAGTVSIVDISPTSPTFGTVTSTVTVGSTPVSVGILSRSGLAAVSNSANSTVSILNLTTNPITVTSPVTSVGANPTGIAVSESLGTALVTNTSSNSVSLFPLASSGSSVPAGLAVDPQPVAAAIAPDLNLAAVAHSGTGNDVFVLNVATGVPAFSSRASNITAPTGVDYDPVNQVFLIDSSASNTVVQLNPITLLQTSIRTGVNPTSLAYNFQSGTLLTLNSSSNTLSVVDLPNSQVRDVLPLSGSAKYALAIHPRLDLAVVSDSRNNRILVLPMPR